MKNKKQDLDKFIFYKMIVTMVILVFVVLGIISYILNTNEHDTNETVTVSVGEFSTLGVYSENDALSSLSPTPVTIQNESSKKTSYKLYFIIKDTSTIDKSFVRVNYNGVTYNIADMNYLELNGGKYFFLIDGEIKALSEESHDAYIWIDSSFNGDRQNAKLFIDFDTLA